MLVFFLGTSRDSMAEGIGFSAGVSSNQVVAGNLITYTINITNTTGFSIANTYVTNRFSGSANNVTATNNLSSSSLPGFNPILISGSTVLFRLDGLTNNGSAILTVNLSPTAAGEFTNSVMAFAVTAVGTNTTTVPTNLVTQVFLGQADLSVTITNIPVGVYSNDWTSIGLIVSNRGPTSAASVILSNALPSSFKLLSSTPASLIGAYAGSVLILNLGTISSGSSTQLVVNVQPTNTGQFALTASVTAASVLDTNLLNNAASNSMSVSPFIDAQLIVTNISIQRFNPQTALMDQSLRVENLGTSNVPAFRLNVFGLTGSNRLVVAVGTNNGLPFVLYNDTLAANQGLDLLLEYHVPLRTPLTNVTFEALAVSKSDLAAPANTGSYVTDPAFEIAAQRLSNGGFMLEFPATSNRTYTILYSDNPAFSNALVSQPSVVSTASRKQWIDNGPPRTLRHPTNAPARFYRVFRTP